VRTVEARVNGKVLVELIKPSEMVLSKEVDSVVVPGEKGEMEILPQHRPLVSTVAPGVMRLRQGSAEEGFVVWGGVVEVLDDRVRVVTVEVERPEDIDGEAARRSAEAVRAKLAEFGGDEDELRRLRNELRLAELRAMVAR